MSKSFGMAQPVHMYNDVTLNQFRPYEDSDETHYWIDIHGVRVSLTKSQFIAMHDARIQLWDKATEHAEQRIIKLLEFYLGETDWSNFEGDSPNVEWIRGFSAALALIKGENK